MSLAKIVQDILDWMKDAQDEFIKINKTVKRNSNVINDHEKRIKKIEKVVKK